MVMRMPEPEDTPYRGTLILPPLTKARVRLPREWRTDHQLWIEVFALLNFASLIADIYLAHSENRFRRETEYIPLVLSIAATAVLVAIIPLRRALPAVWRDVGYAVGWLSVAVGLGGVVLHLDS